MVDSMNRCEFRKRTRQVFSGRFWEVWEVWEVWRFGRVWEGWEVLGLPSELDGHRVLSFSGNGTLHRKKPESSHDCTGLSF